MWVGLVVVDMPGDSNRDRGAGGEFVPEVSLEDVLGVFEQVRGPVVVTGDVMDALDCGRETARQKLTRLADQGRVERRKKGRTIVWWRSDDVVDPASTFTRLSRELDEAIVVGDTVYEDGDQHPLSDAESDMAACAVEEGESDESV
jgi:predicted ArsR family transcriptional regulator